MIEFGACERRTDRSRACWMQPSLGYDRIRRLRAPHRPTACLVCDRKCAACAPTRGCRSPAAQLVTDVHEASEEEEPPRLFLCREGLARFAVEMYEPPTDSNMKNVHMHLTNYSSQLRQASNHSP